MISHSQLFASFAGKEILLEQGRILYSLLYAFSSAGYRISLHETAPNGPIGKYGERVYDLLGLTRIASPPADTGEWMLLYDREGASIAGLSWRKKIEVRFDVFSPYWFRDPIIMPFPLHPAHTREELKTRLERYRLNRRNVRIFFSGSTKGYRHNLVRYPKPKLSRFECIETLRQRLNKRVLTIRDSKVLNDLRGFSYINKCVIVDNDAMRVDHREWLSTLSNSEFFLGLPGVVMPMCHNIVEAMAVGSIPITSYPEWFNPSLTPMTNCIVFDDGDDLVEKIIYVLAMRSEKISAMREEVIEYFERYLKPERFVSKVEARKERDLTVLVITERNCAVNVSRLNRTSILIRGSGRQRNKAWFERLLLGK